MFRYIDLENVQQYFDDAGLDNITPIKYEGSFVGIRGTSYNFETNKPGTFTLDIIEGDTYIITTDSKKGYKLRYDENSRREVECFK